MINYLRHITTVQEAHHRRQNAIPHKSPMFLEKTSRESIGTRRLAWAHLGERHFDC
jgi:hypothetical protein